MDPRHPRHITHARNIVSLPYINNLNAYESIYIYMQSTQNKVHTHDSYRTVTFNNYIPINGQSTIYNKDSRESLKITKSTMGHDTMPFNPYH